MSERSITPEDAVERFLRRRRGQSSAKTVRSYANRLEHFRSWCDQEGIESMRELDGWQIDEFYHWRAGHGVQPVTVKGTLAALRQMLKYCEEIDAVAENIHRKIPTLSLSQDEERSDTRLEQPQAAALIGFYRDSTRYYGHRWHAALELLWHVGCRVGGARALDIGDFDREAGTVHFRNRPDEGTRLKNDAKGERIVEVNAETARALGFYIDRERPDVRDDHGREPLFATTHGRASIGTIRNWAYLGTQPCLYRECPHGRQRRTCAWTDRSECSKCPSSRSPHAIRTGSITAQLGVFDDIEIVADRVNAAPSTIRRYYDVAGPEERFEDRRKGVGSKFDIMGAADDV